MASPVEFLYKMIQKSPAYKHLSRRRFVPQDGYTSPQIIMNKKGQVADCILRSVLAENRMMLEEANGVEAYTGYLLHERLPNFYYLDKNLGEAFSRTDGLLEVFNSPELALSCAFILLHESCLDGVEWIFFCRDKYEGDDLWLFTHKKKNENSKSAFIPSSFDTWVEEYLDGIKSEESHKVINLVANILCYLRQLPEEIDVVGKSGSLFGVKGVANTKKIHQLAQPNWIGKNYRIKSEPKGGTHASPIMHWRRGHWHTYWTGKGRTKKVLKWIEPALVNAGHSCA